ncbi:Helix-turn-helix domain-containing protein [Paenibacillus sp. UNCCL117]|uniref:response regulator transcription factor n=1 Tax=unclassified Paenibacillus TaxID=185978 RepID=UPI0008882F8C|nr:MULTISPECIES: response regulator [unclassified Paenibacillus]SDD48327.1 Helix-turn-helix domain-containing protein [Paenibacillus sp. cl123]SFW50273.1 Helix-turn-helix domain-containing protein [Paenibacillus sp. UNCCL117]
MFKLLVVDDEHDTRDTLCHCFPWESVGFIIVQLASNGLEALQYMLEQPVDAVLCDIRMPGMTGLELCRSLSERQLPVRVILLSAYREFEYARQAMQYGVRHYMVKPATYKDMVEVFSELRRELEDAAALSAAVSAKSEAVAPAALAEAEDPVIVRISAYVNEHYQTATLQEAAELVHMNASYISSYYKKKTGRNFSELVLEARMRNAARLLKQGRLKTYEISERVGYVNPKNFIRSFKQYFGKTPGQYKHE